MEEDKDEDTLYYYTHTTCWQRDDLLLDIKRWDESVKRKAADMIDNIQMWCPALDNNNSSALTTEDSKIVVKVEPLDEVKVEPVSVMDVVKKEETDGENMRSDNDVTLSTELNDLVTDETDGDILVENVQREEVHVFPTEVVQEGPVDDTQLGSSSAMVVTATTTSTTTATTSIHGDIPHKCKQCGESFATRSSLKRHIFTHADKKSYNCSLCSRSFSQYITLKHHLLMHTHTCKQCEKSFATSQSLRQHLLTHNGEKPFKCEHCGKSFAQKSYLKIT